MIGSDRPRLARMELFRHPREGALLVTEGGGLLRLRAPVDDISVLLRDCGGELSIDELVARHPLDGNTEVLLKTLADHGALSVAGPTSTSTCELYVLGDPALTALVPPDGFDNIVLLDSIDELGALDAGTAFVLAIHTRLVRKTLHDIASRCRLHRIRWTHLHLESGKGWLGPHIEHGRGPDLDDLLARRLTAAADPYLLEALDAPVDIGEPHLPTAADLRWIIATALADIRRWATGAMAAATWHEVELDPTRLALTGNPVLPFDTVDPPDFVGDRPHDWLVNPRTGIVRRLTDVRHHPSIPRTLTTVHAKVCDISRVSAWRNDPVAGGSTFGDRDAAARAAVGEAVERYCGNIVQPDLLTKASFAELTRSRQRAVAPETLVLFSEKQYDAPGFPFVRFTNELEVHWVRGRSLTRDEPVWLPASMVYANWYTPTYAGDPPTNPTFFPGIAAGPDLESAVAAGLQEVVERHATMTWWLNAAVLPAVPLTDALNAVWPDETTDVLRRWLIPLDNEFGIPVLAGCVEHEADGLLTIGFAARPDPVQAGLKAWTEALTLQDIARDMQMSHGSYRKAVESGRIHVSSVKPWRADRRYLDDYRSDFHDVTDLTAQVQVHLDRRAQDLVRPWVDVPADGTLPCPLDGSLKDAVEDLGYEIFYADITTPDVRAAGLRVARTLVPGLVPNSAAAFPHLGRDVVRNTPVLLGWRSTPLEEHELNLVPMPHA